jgi:hypothetical protein
MGVHYGYRPSGDEGGGNNYWDNIYIYNGII